MSHPDQDSSAFNHSQGWCRVCGKALRITDPKYFRNEQGPACSMLCVEKVAEVQTFAPDGL